MNPSRHLADIQSLTAALKRQQLITLLVSGVAALLVALVMGKTHTVILEPPVRSKSIAVVGDRVDAAWLEEMGAWMAHMMLDASPSSIAWQQEQVLRWTHPSRHGQLQQEMAVQAKRLTDANASTVFWLQQTAPDPDNRRIALIGTLDTYVNGTRVPGSSRSQSYVASFASKGGRMLLEDFHEVPNDDIWLTRLQERLARKATSKPESKPDAKVDAVPAQ